VFLALVLPDRQQSYANGAGIGRSQKPVPEKGLTDKTELPQLQHATNSLALKQGS
jgi:hypothetical protein